MLAVGGTSCISLVSVAAADENSLTPLHRLLPTETASLGFGGSPVGGGDKNSRFAFFRHFYVGVVSLPSGRCGCVGITPRGVYFGRKTAFSEWVLCADGRAVPSCTQRFFGVPAWGWYHYPRRAPRVVETLDGRLSKGLICRFLDLIDPSLIPVAQYMISFSLQMQEYPIAAKRRKGCSPLLRQSRHIGARGKFPVRR